MQFVSDLLHILIEVVILLSAIIPLVVALVKYIKKAIKEKNWRNLLRLAIQLMEQAERQFDNGADKKDFVISMLKTSLDEIEYEITDEELSNLVDSLVDLTKKLNIK